MIVKGERSAFNGKYLHKKGEKAKALEEVVGSKETLEVQHVF